MIRVITFHDGGEELNKEVEGDLQEFEKWFVALGNDPLVRSEIAILKTYLFYKATNAASSASRSSDG